MVSPGRNRRTRLAPLVVMALWALAASANAEPPQRSEKPSHSGRRISVPSSSSHPVIRPAFPAASASAMSPEQRERMQQRFQELRERIGERHRERERVGALERDVDESLKSGHVDRDVLRRKLEAFWAARAERQRERRLDLRSRWGDALSRPGAKEELMLHGRRMARLRRLEYLTATDRSGDKRAAMLARITRLKQAERERHEQAMAKLSALPAPAVSAVAKPAAASSGSTP